MTADREAAIRTDALANQVRAGIYGKAPLEELVAMARQADRYRIEADVTMREYDGLELTFRETLEKIAEGRRNERFDPWARQVALDALTALDASGEQT